MDQVQTAYHSDFSDLHLSESDKGMSDRDILTVINPPKPDRDSRSSRINPNAPSGHETAISLPSHAAWRYESRIGRVLDPQSNLNVVRSNHFVLNHAAIPTQLYQYAVHLYPVDRTGAVTLFQRYLSSVV